MRTTSLPLPPRAFDEFGELVAVGDARFVDVGDVELGLHGDEEEVAGDELFVVGEVGRAGGLAGVEDFEQLLDRRARTSCGGRGVTFGGFLGFGEALFDGVEVGEQELGVDDVDVVDGVDAAGDVDHLGVGEAADDVQMASVWRMWLRNWLPRPSPLLAPSTMPAMSTNSMVVGTMELGLTMVTMRSMRSSGTGTMPTLGSMVQKG